MDQAASARVRSVWCWAQGVPDLVRIKAVLRLGGLQMQITGTTTRQITTRHTTQELVISQPGARIVCADP